MKGFWERQMADYEDQFGHRVEGPKEPEQNWPWDRENYVPPQVEPSSDLRQLAKSMRELYESLKLEGFDKAEALYMTVNLLKPGKA